jgi:hypothetical protein
MLLYVMAWSIVLAWGSRLQPTILLGVLVVAGLMSLRRNSKPVVAAPLPLSGVIKIDWSHIT